MAALLACPWSLMALDGDGTCAMPATRAHSDSGRVSRSADFASVVADSPQMAGVAENDDEDGSGSGLGRTLPLIWEQTPPIAWPPLEPSDSPQLIPIATARTAWDRSTHLRC
jgi:hypothetical protein